jgi:flagellar motility protein MotE (MotC chaperone)
MAARSNVSVGVGVTITLLIVSTATFLVLFAVYFSRAGTAEEQRKNFEADVSRFMRGDDRNNPVFRALQTEAGNRSVAAHVADQVAALGSRLGGGAMNFKALNDQLDALVRLPAEVSSQPAASVRDAKQRLESELSTSRSTIADLQRQLADARTKIQTDAQAAEANRAFLEERLRVLEGEVRRLTDQSNASRDALERERQRMRDEIVRLTRSANDERITLATQLNRKDDQIRDLEARAATLERRLGGGGRIEPRSEEALVDGTVVSVDPADPSTIYLSVGRRERVVLGMTFEVFGSAVEIREDSERNYAPGKASIEIIRVDETGSVGRVTRQARGRSIVAGDVIANALFSPTKQYLFLVAGSFDTRGTGVATPEGAREISALITQWGGRLTDELTGDVDFLVLGSRPAVPPRPPAGAPLALEQEWSRLDRAARRYDSLMEEAMRKKIPVLNQNRLETLTGLGAGGRR